MKTLRIGDRGPEVRTLQEKLTRVGHPLDPLDGIFGSKTDQAIRDFQKLSGLGVDGVVGPNTWSAIDKEINTLASLQLKTLRKNTNDPLVAVLQKRLTSAGFTISPQTQFFGALTDTEVRKFQRKHGLIADGIVGPATWQALGLQDVKKTSEVKNSAPAIVASLGVVGTLAAAKAKQIPSPGVVAKPVSHLTTSTKGLQFLYTREAWKGVSNRLHWPGGASGVTLGPGYDMKERTEADIASDLTKVGVHVDTAKIIAKAAGLTGEKAKKFCRDNRNLISLPDQAEFKLMQLVVPSYERLARKKIKVDLMQYEFDALVSFTYNFGELWTSIANHINNGDIDAAMKRLKEGNKSGGNINDGLTKRRALEVALFVFADYGKLRTV